jgi:hypothetical protein
MLGEKISFSAAGEEFRVGNISESGMSLLHPELTPQSRWRGILHLAGKEIPVELEIVRQSGSEAGGRLLKGGEELGAEMQRLFADELQATRMSEVSSGHLQTEEEGRPHWFYAPGNFELYFVEKEGRIMAAHISWNDRLVSAKLGEKARAGRMPEENRDKLTHSKSALVEWQATLTDADRYKALRIVENVKGLDTFKEQLITLFRN